MNGVARVEVLEAANDSEVGFSGYVHGIGLVDLLQIFHYSRRNLVLHVEPNSTIHLREGEIVHATTGSIEGDLAITNLLARAGGRIRTAEAVEVPTTIHRPFNFLILDALRDLDEAGRDGPDTMPEESATFATVRGSRFPSIPVAGGELLAVACQHLAERIESVQSVSIVDLVERSVLANYRPGRREGSDGIALSLFERPAALALEGLLLGDGEGVAIEEVRVRTSSGLSFGKTARAGAIGMVVEVEATDAPGLAWAELRQSTATLDRIMP
jgi:Domain of unknown function (DUF4388)